jgi:hypothetical protein
MLLGLYACLLHNYIIENPTMTSTPYTNIVVGNGDRLMPEPGRTDSQLVEQLGKDLETYRTFRQV